MDAGGCVRVSLIFYPSCHHLTTSCVGYVLEDWRTGVDHASRLYLPAGVP